MVSAETNSEKKLNYSNQEVDQPDWSSPFTVEGTKEDKPRQTNAGLQEFLAYLHA